MSRRDPDRRGVDSLSAEGPPSTWTQRLSAGEVRVLGCLLEKQRTTPDVYPLSLNALRSACNQSTNRDPVVDYDDAMIRDALHRLERRGWVRLASGVGSRAPKYRHLLAEVLPMGAPEQAVISVLMLRGPQTPGELKQRSERMHPFAELAAVHDTLERLIDRGLAVRLPRRPGHKEERYAHTLEDPGEERPEGRGDESPVATVGTGGPVGPSGEGWPFGSARGGQGAEGRGASPELAALRERVERLEREVAELRADRRPDGHNSVHESP